MSSCTTPKITVIVVDDDVFMRRALRTQLGAAGFKVIAIDRAESLLKRNFPLADVCLLLDICLPGLTGVQLCRELIASGRQLPTVLMTGRDDGMSSEIMRETGAAASLFKPFDEKALLSAIRKALRRQPKLPP